MSTTSTIAKFIECTELCNTLESSKDNVLLVDVRTPAEFGEAHISDSVNVPLPDLEKVAEQLKEKSKDKEIILVCRTQKRAETALDNLSKKGLENCKVLSGGINSWMETGNKVNQGKKGISIERQVRIVAGSMVVIGSLLTFIHPGFLAIPIFVGSGLAFAGITDTCGMALMLAKLPFNRKKSCSL